MAKNNIGRITLERVSQTASVRREKAATRTMRTRVADNSFDGASTSHPRSSHPFGSRSRLSQAYYEADHKVHEALKAREEVVVDVDSPL